MVDPLRFRARMLSCENWWFFSIAADPGMKDIKALIHGIVPRTSWNLLGASFCLYPAFIPLIYMHTHFGYMSGFDIFMSIATLFEKFEGAPKAVNISLSL